MDVIRRPESQTAWGRLNFPRRCLSKPIRGGKGRNLMTVVNKQIAIYASDSSAPTVQSFMKSRFRPQSAKKDVNDERTAQRAAVKLGEGDVKGAKRVLCSCDVIAQPCRDRLAELQLLHPLAPLDRRPPAVSSIAPLMMAPAAVYAAVMSFSSGSAGGTVSCAPNT